MNQSAWASALVDPERPCPAGLQVWNGSDPGRRFAVYRNNRMQSLIAALAETFPVTQQLVGEDFFSAMAAVFIHRCPPVSPILVYYGRAFPDFVQRFEPAASLPYLADIARLEMAYVESYHAADATALAPERIQAALADPERLARARLVVHPALREIESAFAIVSLWAAHQGRGELSGLHLSQPQSAWILRKGLSVEVMRVPTSACRFIAGVREGLAFAHAVEQAMAFEVGFDLPECLALLLREQMITGIEVDADT